MVVAQRHVRRHTAGLAIARPGHRLVKREAQRLGLHENDILIVIVLVEHARDDAAQVAELLRAADVETTRLLGVRVDRIIALAFGLGSALAAASGIMWALRYPQINPYMGIFPGFKAFIAAVLGGIGSIQGAMIGGLLLGFIEIMTVAFMPSLSGYRDAFAFVVLVLVLLVRPTGLFGQRSEEKI